MEITAKMVKDLREATGVQMMVCKEALKEAEGSMEDAKRILRIKGIQDSGRRDHKEAASGIIYTYNHDGRVGVMLKLKCETDFVAKNEEFQDLAKTIAMHIAWAKPQFISSELVLPSIVEEEEEIARSQVPEGKPDEIVKKIIAGKMRKFYEGVCLLNQKELQISEGKITIGDMIKAFSGKVGEKIEVGDYSVFEI